MIFTLKTLNCLIEVPYVLIKKTIRQICLNFQQILIILFCILDGTYNYEKEYIFFAGRIYFFISF